MDQLKDILKQMIKYRFWIAVGLAALLPLIAYFVGTGKIKGEADSKKREIEGADNSVKEYASGTKPNQQWSTIVKGKTEVLTADVNSAWKKLYDRQGPLLQWPKEPPEIEEKFHQWGKEWPKSEDAAAVQLVIDKYILVYNDEVKQVYKICRPFNPEDGSGVVLAPTVDGLLQPIHFDPNNPPSDLGKIWAAQEKLWVLGALLNVIDKVNKSAKDWDTAPLKQINDLQVANAMALDQVSIADGVTLTDAPSITKGGEAGAPAPAAADAAAGEGTPGAAMPGMPGGGFGATSDAAVVSYLSSSNKQYNVVPVSLSVLIDQNSINNLLVELANSPMAIQVIDYEQTRPQARVTKPEKGQSLTGGMAGGFGMEGGSMPMTSGRMGMMMRRGMGMEGMFNMSGGVNRGDYRNMQRGMSGRGMAMEGGGSGYGGRMPGAPGGYGAGAGGSDRKGTDVRSQDLEKQQEERKKARAESKVTVKIHDPYYNILEVRVYGQARFYNAPPAEQPAESTSAGETAAAAPGAETPAAATAEGQAAPAKTESDKAKEEPAKEESEKAKDEPAKADSDKPKEDAPKADDAKEDAPKSDAPKSEPAKGEAPKTEAPTDDAAKPAAPQPKR
ncbi:MAG TPA: hypothetical protein VGY53_02775 [Isosphaeraceae bacterium]|nr:hypothetical protein [Isosphaeraceae bacterium]